MRLAGGRKVDYGVNSVTDDYLELLHIPLVAGRWFSREDDAATWTPVVVNRRWRGRSSATRTRSGRSSRKSAIPNDPPPDPNDKPEVKRVIGVIDEFRQNGELSTPGNYLFYRMRLDGPDPEGGAARAPVRAAETRHHGGVRGDARQARRWRSPDDWSFEVQPLDAMREDKLRQYTMPLVVVGTIAGVPAADGGARPDRRGVAERDAADPRVRPAPRQGRDDRRTSGRRCSSRWSS